jgi:methylase of polypeptide subunit release factors
MSISEWLLTAEKKLARKGVQTARLDALVLLEAACGKDRAYLLAHPEDSVPALADTSCLYYW